VRMQALACVFERGFDERGRQLFYYELSEGDQVYLFLNPNPQAGAQVVTVVRGLSVALDAEMTNDTNLMEAMIKALKDAQQPEAGSLIEELINWKDGRLRFEQNAYSQAIAAFSKALGANTRSHNPALRYDRAKAYLAVGRYADALGDLDQMINIAMTLPPTPTPKAPAISVATALLTVTSAAAPATVLPGAITPTVTTQATGVPLPTAAQATVPSLAPAAPITAIAILTRTVAPAPPMRLRFLNRETIIETVVL